MRLRRRLQEPRGGFADALTKRRLTKRSLESRQHEGRGIIIPEGEQGARAERKHTLFGDRREPHATATALSGRIGTAPLTITVSDAAKATSQVALTLKVGGNSNDALVGTCDTDVLLGQNGDDTISGLGGEDLLCGGLGNDDLPGGADDTLSGGAGNGRLTGGTGTDRFSGGKGTDTASDFTPTQGDSKDNTIP